jgi:hypothetical protein
MALVGDRQRWYFLVEFARKFYINFLYIRGYLSDDGALRMASHDLRRH